MTRMKMLLVACGALGLSFGAAVVPADAQDMMMHRGRAMHHHRMMMHHDRMMMRHDRMMMRHDRMMHHRMMRRHRMM